MSFAPIQSSPHSDRYALSQDRSAAKFSIRPARNYVAQVRDAKISSQSTYKDAVKCEIPLFSQEARFQAMVKMGAKIVPLLMKCLESGSNSNYIKENAARIIKEIGPSAKASVPVLISILKNSGGVLCCEVAEALGAIGPAAKSAVPALIGALKHSNEYVAKYAAQSLGKIGPAARASVPALVKALKSNHFEVRYNAAEALGKIGVVNTNIVRALFKIYGEKDGEYVSRAVGKTLDTLVGPKASAAVPALIEALTSPKRAVRKKAVALLDKMGPLARAAMPKLVDMLKNQNDEICFDVVRVLGRIRDARAVPALIRILNRKDSSKEIRGEVIKILGSMKVRKSVPTLIRVLEDAKEDENVRASAARALGLIGDRRAVAVLIAALKKGDLWVSDEAEKALERFKDKKAKEALRSHRRRGFRPHWFIAGGAGGFLSAANVFHGLSTKTLHIPPHPDDYAKYDQVSTAPFSKKDGVDVGVGSVFFDIGYKYSSYFGLKNRFSLFFFESLAGYPPLIRKRYESEQNAFTYLVPAFAISNTVLADLSNTYYSNEKVGFPWFAIGLEVGLSVTLIGYEYGWDRYAKRQWGGVRCGGGIGPQVGAYVKMGAVKVGVSFDILHSGFYMARTYFSIQYPFGFEKE